MNAKKWTGPTSKYTFWHYSEWSHKYSQLEDVIVEKDNEISLLKDELKQWKLKIKELNIEVKKSRMKNKELTHNHEVASNKLDGGVIVKQSLNSKIGTFPLIPKATKENTDPELRDGWYMNKIGVTICSYLELREFKKLSTISKRMQSFITYNIDILHLMNNLHSDNNSRYKKKIISMKTKMNSLEEEVSRKKKVLYLDYDDSKRDIKQYLADFMIDGYEPGKRIKEYIDKSCNMIINYSRISNIEDPIDRVRKELKQSNESSANGDSSAMSILRKSIMSIGGHSFGYEDNSKDKLGHSPINVNKTSSFAIEKETAAKSKGHRSKGIFDTLFRPLELETIEEVKNQKSSKHESKTKDTNAELESDNDFFDTNLGMNDRVRSGTIAVSNPSDFTVANLTSMDIIRFYEDKPKDLMKLFHNIGSKIMNSKDNKGGKWISDIIKNYVSLLISTMLSVEEMQKLDTIKHYFALKIEKTIEEK